VLQFFET
jgi:cyclophilin family peptidyl-prolyl cis-trans isomerase